ncbi:hypothetical protein FA13DRAFT_1736527 [Coprinellus micaceus]|uniref:Uncharacterized protein n=1 Tax=Coprinellus micaceus TaxID=71717 RepID=A0A4Y7T0G8_COPMI|nr:hypothetical protein FA13DRAFT_1736527 [Coprinellus micaceus]
MTTPPFTIERPTYSEAEVAENPWYAIELGVYDILAGIIESRSATSISAAQQLNSLFPTNRPQTSAGNEAPESFLWEFWGIVAKVVAETPLIDFLKALRDLLDPVELQLENWGSVKLWADLPLLGPVFREALDTYQGMNLEAFLARLTQAGIANWSWLGLVSLHAALEVEPDSRARAYKEQGPILEASVPRAVIWLEIAGRKLYEGATERALRDEKYGSGGNWKGSAGFSQERWDYWKKRFSEISVQEQASDATKNLAKKGEQIMAGLEN